MNDRQPEKLAARTKRFALAVIRLYGSLPRSIVSYIAGRQLLKSGTSVGAHYREARRAKSAADFISKMEGGLQELDETGYWLELLAESGLGERAVIDKLSAEVNELISIFVTIARRTRTN
ncbi:MAG TPA: four helix bundle protein [Burkholderiales bacterium]|nr:four helix bundle protein [Burkholderiales bacterium]